MSPTPGWKAAGLQWIAEYFEANEDSDPLQCQPSELDAHGEFVGQCVKGNVDPTHFIKTVIRLQVARRKLPPPQTTISFRDGYEHGEPVEVKMPLIDWIEGETEGGLEHKIETSRLISCRLLQIAIEAGKIEPEEAAVMLNASGDNFLIEGPVE